MVVQRLPAWFANFIARPRVSLIALNLATVIDRPLMRVSGGRLRLSFIVPVMLLRCRGARTGALREVPLLYTPDGEDALLVASNGGQATRPAWCYNLRAHPEVSALMNGQNLSLRATELSGSERERAWHVAVTLYPGFARYAERVADPLPVFRLSPIAAGQS